MVYEPLYHGLRVIFWGVFNLYFILVFYILGAFVGYEITIANSLPRASLAIYHLPYSTRARGIIINYKSYRSIRMIQGIVTNNPWSSHFVILSLASIVGRYFSDVGKKNSVPLGGRPNAFVNLMHYH